MSESKKPTVTSTAPGGALGLAEPSPLDVEIDRWLIDHFGIATPVWLSPDAKADLKKRLAALGGNP